MRAALLTAALAAATSVAAAAPAPQPVGVNIGGWLVLESWLTPSLYDKWNVTQGVGELQFCETLGKPLCLHALQQHWDAWVTEADFKALASAGVTSLRIPIGYWILGPPYLLPSEGYVAGGWPYLMRALRWAKASGLSVLIDLHGAPGSQNGHDNSGSTGPIEWLEGDNINRTVAVLAELARNLTVVNTLPGYEGVVVSIETLNEPWTTVVGGPIPMPTLKAFYSDAIAAMRSAGWTGGILLHDGWNLTYWRGYKPDAGAALDTHNYFCFGGPHDSLSDWQQVQAVCASDGPWLQGLTDTLPVIVGEWSLCIPNLPDYPLNGDATAWIRALMAAQWQAYGSVGPASVPGATAVAGSYFWTFKTEGPSWTWDFLNGLSQGYITNLTSVGGVPANGTLPGGAGGPFFDCSVFTKPLEQAALDTAGDATLVRTRRRR